MSLLSDSPRNTFCVCLQRKSSNGLRCPQVNSATKAVQQAHALHQKTVKAEQQAAKAKTKKMKKTDL